MLKLSIFTGCEPSAASAQADVTTHIRHSHALKHPNHQNGSCMFSLGVSPICPLCMHFLWEPKHFLFLSMNPFCLLLVLLYNFIKLYTHQFNLSEPIKYSHFNVQTQQNLPALKVFNLKFKYSRNFTVVLSTHTFNEMTRNYAPRIPVKTTEEF